MNKIRLYDFLSFMLPGLFVASAISFLLSCVIPILPKGFRFEDLSTIGGSIVYLVVAFIIGHVVQVFGNEYEVKQTKYWGKRPLKTAKHPETPHSKKRFDPLISLIATILPIFRIFSSQVKEKLGLIPNENGGW